MEACNGTHNTNIKTRLRSGQLIVGVPISTPFADANYPQGFRNFLQPLQTDAYVLPTTDHDRFIWPSPNFAINKHQAEQVGCAVKRVNSIRWATGSHFRLNKLPWIRLFVVLLKAAMQMTG